MGMGFDIFLAEMLPI